MSRSLRRMLLKTTVTWFVLFAITATAQQILLPDEANDPTFGHKIAASSTDLAIASVGYSDYVAIYRRPAGEWQRVQTLYAREGAREYGYAMAMSEHWLAVAWRDYDAAPGTLETYIDLFRRDGDEWSFVEQIDSPVQTLRGYIQMMALSDTALVVREVQHVGETTIIIKLHVLGRSGEGWGAPQILTAPGATNTFGIAFDVSDEMLAVADSGRNTTGAITTFRRSGGTWVPASTLGPPSTVPAGGFGQTLAICGERLAVQLLKVSSGNPNRIAIFEGGPDLWSLSSEVAPSSDLSFTFGFDIQCNAFALVTGGGSAREFFYALPLTGVPELLVLQPFPLPPPWGYMCLGFAVIGGDAICSTQRQTFLPPPQPESEGIVYAFNDAVDRLFVSGFD